MNMLKKYGLLIIVLGIAILVGAPKGDAVTFHSDGNPGDNASGEVITAVGSYETLDYQDANSNQKPTTFPATDIATTVSPEYGMSMDVDAADETVTPGQAVIAPVHYIVTNEGNADFVGTLSALYNYFNSADGWIVELWWDPPGIVAPPSLVATLTAASVFQTSANFIITEDFDNPDGWYYNIYVSSEVTGAPDGSYIIVSTTWETTDTPVGTYEGANTYLYGGTSEADDANQYTLAAPLLVLTRTSTIDSPRVYQTKGGGANDPVPGAVASYKLVYSNLGSASAESVVVIDRITTKEGTPGTNLAHINAAGATTHVDLTLASPGDMIDGWTISYSILTAPATTYGATAGWTVIGTTTGSNAFPSSASLYSTSSNEYAARWIKFEKASIDPTEDGVNINWGVTIR